MSGRSYTALLAALANTGPAGAKAAERMKLLSNPRERHKMFLGEVEIRKGLAFPHINNAKRRLAAANARMSTLATALATTSSSQIAGPAAEELERTSRWFGLRYVFGRAGDAPKQIIIERIDRLISLIASMKSVLDNSSGLFIVTDDVFRFRTAIGRSTIRPALGITWFSKENIDALDRRGRVIFTFKGPAVTLSGVTDNDGLNTPERAAVTVIHEALHVYKGRSGSVHPLRSYGFEFDGTNWPGRSKDFTVISEDEQQWTCYLLNYNPY